MKLQQIVINTIYTVSHLSHSNSTQILLNQNGTIVQTQSYIAYRNVVLHWLALIRIIYEGHSFWVNVPLCNFYQINSDLKLRLYAVAN